MGFVALIIVALGTTAALIWPIARYAPLHSIAFGKSWSPRLFICKLLAPFDIVMTFFLVLGSVTGLLTTVTGISALVYNVLVGLGLSFGVVIIHEFFRPRWEKEYAKLKEA